MNRAIAWFAWNGVAANLLMVLILAGGLATLPGIKQEIFPEIPSEVITVSVEYPGASPTDIEESICMRIEESVQGLAGIERIRSEARENIGTVFVEMTTGTDPDRLLEDVKSRVDGIDTFPDEAEEPLVQEVVLRRQVVNVSVSGPASEKDLRKIAERVRDDLSTREGISLVLLGNARPYEISVEVSELDLRRYGLTFDHVAEAVRNASLDLPGGSVKTAGGEILVRTKGQAYRGPEFERLPLLTRPDGTRIRLGDVARVVDGFAETDQSTRFDGQPSILVQVFRIGEQNALDIAAEVEEYIAQARGWLPEGIALTTWQDDSKVLRSRLDLMIRNGRMGLLLVFASLALFLRLRLAFWVALGIPISFLGAIWLLPAVDVSINLISLFAFIVVLGIVVDDAIVVGENIYTRVQRGERGIDAAVRGASEVGKPVVFAVLTSMAAFVPLLLVPGRYGEFMRVVPIIVILTLLFSLLESLLVLPRHLSHFRPEERAPRGPARLWRAVQDRIDAGLAFVIHRLYRPSLDFAIRWRYFTVSVGLAVLLATGGLVQAGWVKFVFFPDVDADNVVAYLTMPQGTSAQVTERAIRRIEHAAEEVRTRLERERPQDAEGRLYRHVLTSVGGQPFREAQSLNRGRKETFSGAHLAEVNIELLPSEQRSVSSTEIARRWEAAVGAIPDAEELSFSSSIFASDDINVELSANDFEALRAASRDLQEALSGYRGVSQITDSFRLGKKELVLDIRPSAWHLGLDLADLARQVRQGFYGEEAQHVQRGRDDVRVMVRYPEGGRASLADVESMRIRKPDGAQVPFREVATARLGRGYSTIERADRRRVINVTAAVDSSVANAREINEELRTVHLPRIAAEHDRVHWGFEGDQRDQAEALESLTAGMAVALVLIYALLAVPFRSYTQPLIVMSAIPFGLVAAVWGHILMGLDLTFLSMFGLVALSGVLVNDSLVMVDFINRHLEDADHTRAAAVEAGAVRFRPILLTSLTTFAGLSPILLEKSLQAKFLIPMAVALGFGVLFATFVTLILVPVGYNVLEDAKALAASRKAEARSGPAP